MLLTLSAPQERCASDLVLDAWRAGELDDARTLELERHLTECGRCARRRRDLDAQAEAWLGHPDHAAPLRRVRRELTRRARRRWLTAGASVAALAALAVFPTLPEPDPGVRRKGGSSAGYYVLRDGQTFRGAADDPVRPGDRLRFTWRPDGPHYLAILSLDARGAASVYYPPAPSAQVPVMPTAGEVELPAAVELDGVLGEEEVFVLACEKPPPVLQLRERLARRGTLTRPPGCELERLLLVKEAAP